MANLHDDVRNTYNECRPRRRARGTPNSVPYIHVNWSFPTPIVISFTSPSFPSDLYPFRCGRDGQPAPSCCCISPTTFSVVIDHGGDRSLPIHQAGTRDYLQHWVVRLPPERVTIVGQNPPPLIWSTATQRHPWGYNATGGCVTRTPIYP